MELWIYLGRHDIQIHSCKKSGNEAALVLAQGAVDCDFRVAKARKHVNQVGLVLGDIPVFLCLVLVARDVMKIV